jgi:hypothetical protein
MAKKQYLHVRNLERYLPAYKDRAFSWFRIYCRDSYDQIAKEKRKSILDEEHIAELDEVNRWRFFSLIAREANLGGPVPCEDREFQIMRWDMTVCSKSKSLRMLQKLVDVLESYVTQRREEKRREEEEEEKTNGPSAPPADWLAPDFPLRFAFALRSLVVPHTKGEQTTQENIGRWVQDEIRRGADPETITKAVLNLADRARTNGRPPMRLFQHLLHEELGYPKG